MEDFATKTAWRLHSRGFVGEDAIADCADVLREFIQEWSEPIRSVEWLEKPSATSIVVRGHIEPVSAGDRILYMRAK